jgi:hypothetical protein
MGTHVTNYEFLMRFDPDTGEYSGSHFKYLIRDFDEQGISPGRESEAIPINGMDGLVRTQLNDLCGEIMLGLAEQNDRLLAQLQTAAEDMQAKDAQIEKLQQETTSLQSTIDALVVQLDALIRK